MFYRNYVLIHFEDKLYEYRKSDTCSFGRTNRNLTNIISDRKFCLFKVFCVLSFDIFFESM